VRILLDECVNAGVRAAFPGHSVKTVSEISWRSSKDGPLLAHAEKAVDVFVTIDRKLGRQHDLKRLRLGFVVAHVPDNEIASELKGRCRTHAFSGQLEDRRGFLR